MTTNLVVQLVKCGKRTVFLGALTVLSLLVSMFFLSNTARAQSISDYDQARSFCISEGGRAVITTPHTDNAGGGATWSEQRSFNCIMTVGGETCDRFRPPERQPGCIVVPSTSIIGRTPDSARSLFVSSAGSTSTGQSKIDGYLATGVNILTGVAGLAIVGSIIAGGIQYSSAGGNASQVSAAKNRIVVSIASLLLLGFGYAILQWLVPGGIFN